VSIISTYVVPDISMPKTCVNQLGEFLMWISNIQNLFVLPLNHPHFSTVTMNLQPANIPQWLLTQFNAIYIDPPYYNSHGGTYLFLNGCCLQFAGRPWLWKGGETRYKSVEVFNRLLVYVLKYFIWGGLQRGFEAMGQALKDRSKNFNHSRIGDKMTALLP
jgi:hypothetical protein